MMVCIWNHIMSRHQIGGIIPRRGAGRALFCVDVSTCQGPRTKHRRYADKQLNVRRSGAPDEVNTLPREAGEFGASR